jgi:prepilin-type N-terminal cleavage/methylation domain-containing protein
METSQSRPDRRSDQRGFTVIEVLVSIGVLTVGLMAMAALMARTLGATQRSQFLGVATTLASEKLEDLNRWPQNDPNVFVPVGSTTVGSLTADVVQNVTSGAVTESINYHDEVLLSATNGSITETRTSLDAGGNLQYVTTSHAANGTITVSAPSTTPPAAQGAVQFKRRWIIEQGQPVAGVRRITVSVTVINQPINPPVTFQMSAVRP